MKHSRQILLFIFIFLILAGCISQFIPKTSEDKQLLVVEGLITDQPGPNTIKLSRSLPLGTRGSTNPVKGCTVSISDDNGQTYFLSETDPGTYVTDGSQFQGSIGRFYTLHINTNNSVNNHTYESIPVELKPVSPIDSVYYEKVTIQAGTGTSAAEEGAQIYLNTQDPSSQCKYFRWEFTETWEFILPYAVPNKICWISANSNMINIKNTSAISEDKIVRYPLNFVSNLTDRLKVKYSILVDQYSLSEDEYNYWDKLQNMSQQVGSLYDIIPSSVSSNVYCLDNPGEKVLGYFSVSARSSKRIFIKDHFAGLANPYSADNCIADTIWGGSPLPQGLNSTVWIIITSIMPPYNVTTYSKGCYDCTVRGTDVEPYFWTDDK
ncbi:MAG: DUF4249 domain-containing protein [Bacteroidales bacterium]